MSSRLAAMLAIVALVVTACPQSSPDDGANNVNELPAPDTSGDDNSAIRETDNELAPARVNDTECFAEEVRCGTVLVPQVPGSPDLAEIGFRVISDSGSGVPVVLLDHRRSTIELDPAVFPDRPLVTVGSRALWPGGPNISCPEWGVAPTREEVAARATDCVTRITAAGIDLAGSSRENQAADVVAVLTALGITEFDLIAPDLRADLVAVIAASPLTVREVIYVQPQFSGADPTAILMAETMATFEAVWSRCSQVTTCTAPGSVEDFLAAIDALEDQPILSPVVGVDVEPTTEPEMIDADRLIRKVLNELFQASGAAFLPQIHRLILERDAETLSRYVTPAFSDNSANGATVACARHTSDAPDFASYPPLLQREAIATRALFDSVCAVWGNRTVETALAPPAGVVVTTLTAVDLAGLNEGVGPVVVEPTVAMPTPDCITSVAVTWFDERALDDAACRTPLAIAGRNDSFNLVAGSYVFDDDTTVLTRIPSTWTDSEDVPLIVEVAAGGGPCVYAASSLDSVSHDGVTVSAVRPSA